MIEVITIANFENAIEANLAKQELEAEGIPAFLADEITVNVAWYLAVAVRWIKLQVPEPDVQQAISILANSRVPNRFAPRDSAELALEETVFFDRAEFQASLDSQDLDREGDDDIVRLSWADQIVERMFRVAVFGLIFSPLQLYSLWLLIRLLVSQRKVSRSKCWKVLITVILNTPIIITLWIIFP